MNRQIVASFCLNFVGLSIPPQPPLYDACLLLTIERAVLTMVLKNIKYQMNIIIP